MDLLTPLPCIEPRKWSVYAPKKSSPQQDNAVDCGIFTTQTAVHQIWGTSVWECVNSEKMTALRELMAIELKNGKLLPRC